MKRFIFSSAFTIIAIVSFAQFSDTVYSPIYDQMRYNAYERPRAEKRERDSLIRANRKQLKPPPLNGFYMNWGTGFGMTPDNIGMIGAMQVGAKLFFGKTAKKRVFSGADISGTIGALGLGETSGLFGINAGPSFAWELGKGNLYVTPYTGVNLGFGRGGGDVIMDTVDSNRKYIDYLIPFGLKLEYQHHLFFLGIKADSGIGQALDVKGVLCGFNAFGFAGLKFYKRAKKKVGAK